MDDSNPPDGYKPLFRTSPFLDHNGPFFYRENDDGTFVVGLRIQPKHANARGIAHGGLLMTLCDIALGYRTTRSQTPSPMLTTGARSRSALAGRSATPSTSHIAPRRSMRPAADSSGHSKWAMRTACRYPAVTVRMWPPKTTPFATC